ncbi:hypothetical protein GCM10008944_01730 [Cytobacillus oceanisediminis]
MSTIPTPPTPPLSPAWRQRLYAAWAWAGALLFVASITWAAWPGQDVPTPLLVAAVALNGVQSLFNFTAANHVDLPSEPELLDGNG